MRVIFLTQAAWENFVVWYNKPENKLADMRHMSFQYAVSQRKVLSIEDFFSLYRVELTFKESK